MSRRYKHWTYLEQQKAIELRKQGMACWKIARMLGREENQVRVKLNRIGDKTFDPKMWTSEEWEFAQDLRYAFDLKYREIGCILDRGEISIKNKFQVERNKERLNNE